MINFYVIIIASVSLLIILLFGLGYYLKKRLKLLVKDVAIEIDNQVKTNQLGVAKQEMKFKKADGTKCHIQPYNFYLKHKKTGRVIVVSGESYNDVERHYSKDYIVCEPMIPDRYGEWSLDGKYYSNANNESIHF